MILQIFISILYRKGTIEWNSVSKRYVWIRRFADTNLGILASEVRLQRMLWELGCIPTLKLFPGKGGFWLILADAISDGDGDGPVDNGLEDGGLDFFSSIKNWNQSCPVNINWRRSGYLLGTLSLLHLAARHPWWRCSNVLCVVKAHQLKQSCCRIWLKSTVKLGKV